MSAWTPKVVRLARRKSGVKAWSRKARTSAMKAASSAGGGAMRDEAGLVMTNSLRAPPVARSDLDQADSARSSNMGRRRMRTPLVSTTWIAFSRLSMERLRLTVSDVRPR